MSKFFILCSSSKARGRLNRRAKQRKTAFGGDKWLYNERELTNGTFTVTFRTGYMKFAIVLTSKIYFKYF